MRQKRSVLYEDEENTVNICNPASTVGEELAVKGTDAQNDQDCVRETVNSWLAELGF